MTGVSISALMRELFPTLSEEKLQEAEFNLRRYLCLVIEIVEQQETLPVDKSFDKVPRKTVASKLFASEENPYSPHP